jgi:hypothetical protein
MSVVVGDRSKKRWLTRLIDLVIRCECAYRDFQGSMAGRFLYDRRLNREFRKPR